ncbi:hypothetical protein AGR13a_Cc310011 [Agrobacterium genomosp. 13 str. CFBP 6927]|uniref:Uncharacterized protein n=1 Tax=Agrobacterium genomosp. 13 str. CFBP 6927 TaxID=1183428 RepID=A0ABP2BK36_9HYPH|nr:hypothetical protein AGR13a_Cc310011 [Agrobacterium genomosp. 13 str. CFBP 6927]
MNPSFSKTIVAGLCPLRSLSRCFNSGASR